MKTDVLVVGGGAAGFFAAINIAMHSKLNVTILEKSTQVLSKVKISGGGRCNVTHAEFIPNELAKHYPRGERELKGPFHTFMSGDVFEWFDRHGVPLKIEEDGRVFPETDDSQTIIDCFTQLAAQHGVKVLLSQAVKTIEKDENEFMVTTTKGVFQAQYLLVATGSSVGMWKTLSSLQHTIVKPVPSLFTFNFKHKIFNDLLGISTKVALKIPQIKQQSEGDLLFTHWGFSGPAILKLSAWGARELAVLQYNFKLHINWLPTLTVDEVLAVVLEQKQLQPKKTIGATKMFNFPKRFWEALLLFGGFEFSTQWANLSKKNAQQLVEVLCNSKFQIQGKSTFKDEFVTAGGVALKEVNFKTMESKLQENLFFAGEVIDVDAITGGFNFQNAWTTAYIAAQTILDKEA